MTGEMPSTCIHPIDPHRLRTSCLARVTESTSKTEVAGSNKYKNPEWSILSFPVKIDPAQNVLHLCPHQNQVTKAQGPGQAADCSSLFLAMLKCARSEVERCARSMSMCCSFSFAKHGKQSWKQIWKPWKKIKTFQMQQLLQRKGIGSTRIPGLFLLRKTRFRPWQIKLSLSSCATWCRWAFVFSARDFSTCGTNSWSNASRHRQQTTVRVQAKSA